MKTSFFLNPPLKLTLKNKITNILLAYLAEVHESLCHPA